MSSTCSSGCVPDRRWLRGRYGWWRTKLSRGSSVWSLVQTATVQPGPDRGAGLLAPDVAALLRAPDDAGRGGRMTNDNKQLSKSWIYIARYALPTGALMFAAIMVGIFTPVWGKASGFATASGIWVIGSVVGVSRFRAWHRKLTAITLLMLGAHMSMAAGATAAMPVPVPVPDESPPVMVVCIDADGRVAEGDHSCRISSRRADDPSWRQLVTA